MKKILIVYYTKTNTTKEFAERIKDVFIKNGFEVDVQTFNTVKSIDGYTGVVVGAPVNGMSWRTEAYDFIKNNKDKLSEIPVTYYLVSYLLKTGRVSIQGKIKDCIKKAVNEVEPVSVGMFGGRIESEMPAPIRLLFGVKKNAPIDVRDLYEVDGWAEHIVNYYK